MILGSRNYHIAVKYILTCVLMSLLCSCHASAATTIDILSGLKPEDSCFSRSQVPALRVPAGRSHVAPRGA